MARSVGMTLAPYMGRGQPYVVITGKFAIGLVSGVYAANRLYLVGLASRYDQSHAFSLDVSGRVFLGTYHADNLANTDDVDLGSAVYDGVGDDRPGSVRIAVHDPDIYWSSVADAESSKFQWKMSASSSPRVDFGTNLTPDGLTIVLRGKLASLDLRKIVAVGTVPGSNGSIASHPVGTKLYNDPVHGAGNGWIPGEVHIFDQPQLKGRVTLPSSRVPRVIWDS